MKLATLRQWIGKGVRKKRTKKRDKAKSQNSGKKREAMLKKWDKAFVVFAKANGIAIPKKKQRKKMWKTLFRHLGRLVGITKGAYIMAEEILSKNGLKRYRLTIIENGKEVGFDFISEEGFDRLHDQAKHIAQDLDTTKSDLGKKQGELDEVQARLKAQEQHTKAKQDELEATQGQLKQTQEVLTSAKSKIESQEQDIKDKQDKLEAAQKQLKQAQNALQAKEQELETLRKDFGGDLLELFTTLPQDFRASLNLAESNPAFILGIRDKLPIVHKRISEMAQRAYKNGQSLESQDFQNLLAFIEKLCAFLCQAGFEYERIETKEGEQFDTAKHIAVNDKVSGTIDKVLLQGFKKGDTLKSLITIKE